MSTSKVLFLETPKTGTVLIFLPEINDFLQNRQWGWRSISICFQTEQNTAHFIKIFPGVNHARNWLTDNDLTDRWLAGKLQEGGLVASDVCLQALFPSFQAIFSPNREPVHRLVRAVLENIGPRSWQYGPSAARSVLPRLRDNIPQYGSSKLG